MAATQIIPRPYVDGALTAGTATPGTHSVPAVEKVFAILEVLADSQTGLTLRELASRCAIPKSSVHGIVVTLQRCGYLHRNRNNSRYLFARKLIRLANDALSGMELRDLALPHMRKLVRQVQLPASLGILEFHEAVIVAKLEPTMSCLPIGSWVGKRMDPHCTGLGKALLAHLPGAELERLVRERTLPRHNDNTISSFKRLKEELNIVRRLGYAIDDEEDILGCRGVAAPVRDREGIVVAALSISGTTTQVTSENVHSLAKELLQAASGLSRELATRGLTT